MVDSAQRKETELFHFTTGAIAGLFADLLTYPFDRLRTIFIVSAKSANHWETFIRAGGPRALYQGFSTVALFTIPVHGVYFGLYEWTVRRLQARQERSRLTEAFSITTAGLVAELGTAPIWNVQEVIKQRIQVRNLRQGRSGNVVPASPWRMFRHILHQEGPTGLFRGFSAGLLVYAPFACIYFWMYEQGRAQGRSPLFNGFLSGTCATIATHPLEVIRTHIVVSPCSRSAWRVARSIHHRYGLRGFFKGMLARTLWLAPSAALSLAFYQQLQMTWSGWTDTQLGRSHASPIHENVEKALIHRGS
jgi:hypothetical protein